MKKILSLVPLLVFVLVFNACKRGEEKANSEQIVAIDEAEDNTSSNDTAVVPLSSNENMKQIASYPNKVILTGLKQHRLLGIYKAHVKTIGAGQNILRKFSYSGESAAYDGYDHYMPGLNALFGYKLLNLAHYDMQSGQQNYFFSKPVLIRTLYYPSVEVDTLNKKPVHRNYYLVSVYDEDTNKDTLITHHDLRHFYLFDSTAGKKTLLLPKNYSVLRSQYDADNDAMFLFARLDANNNGSKEDNEPIHVFWVDLNAPAIAKRMY